MTSKKSLVWSSSCLVVLVVAVLTVLVLAAAAHAATPCCAITAIDAKAGVVTAKETATGRAFQFEVKDVALLKSLKVGQKISADLKAMTVTLPAARLGGKTVQVRILKAEPVGRPAEPVGRPQARRQGASGTAKPGGKKSTSVNLPALSVGALAVNPQFPLIYPDLVPHVYGFVLACSWNESQGETCESECPPREVTRPLGTKNISQRPLSGPVRIRVLAHPSGNVIKDWTVTDVAGNGFQLPGWIKQTIVRCHPEGQATVGTLPPPNYKLIVETNAMEANKNNNTLLIYIGPDSQLGP